MKVRLQTLEIKYVFGNKTSLDSRVPLVENCGPIYLDEKLTCSNLTVIVIFVPASKLLKSLPAAAIA